MMYKNNHPRVLVKPLLVVVVFSLLLAGSNVHCSLVLGSGRTTNSDILKEDSSKTSTGAGDVKKSSGVTATSSITPSSSTISGNIQESNHRMFRRATNQVYDQRHLKSSKSKSDSSSSKSSKQCKGLNFKEDTKKSYSSSTSKSNKGGKSGKDKVIKTCKRTKKPKKTDVVVIGAGVAGIRATARIQEVAPELDVTVLEASDRIGGRVESFFTDDGLVLQKGANWLNPGTPVTALYEQKVSQNGYVVDNPLNMTVYEIMCPGDTNGRSLRNSDGIQKAKRILERLEDEDNELDETTREMAKRNVHRMIKRLAVEVCTAIRVPSSDIDLYANKWNDTIVPCMNQVTLDFFFEVFDPEDDLGVVAELLACGWEEDDPLDFLFKFIYYDYEFGNRDGSIFGWFDFAAQPILFVTDDWEKSVVSYAAENNIEPVFETRVTKIEYDLNNGVYKARVTAQEDDGDCVVYEAQRVISTVAAGVYNNDLIAFDPPLLYPDAEYNPMKMRNYVKIFYRFPEKFWGDSESHYIYPIVPGAKEETSVFWQDLSRDEIFPDSNILMLTLLEESFRAVVGEENVREEEIPHDILMSLLEPLKITFPDTFVEPCDTFYNTYHSNPDFGFGSYSNWDVGYSPYEYFNFWGSYDLNQYIAPCDHNGCNSQDEWILFLSGTAMCLALWEYVDGAWHGGEFTANLMMESLGIDVGIWDQMCYV